MPKAKKTSRRGETRRQDKGHASSKRSFIVCPDTFEKVWITTVTLTDINRAARTGEAPPNSNRRRELLRIPSKQNRLAIYTEAAHAIENKERECMALYGGRPWTITAKVTEPKPTNRKKPPLFRWFRGQLELATLPHLLEKIPDPPRLKGKQEYQDEEYVPLSTSLEERTVSSLSTVAWEDRDHAIPTVTLKWLSPDHVYFYSRKSAWEYQKTLATQQLFIQRHIHGLGFRGNKLRPFKPTRKDAMQAGKWRFERDGLWVVGQEQSWQAERTKWFQQQEKDKTTEAAAASKVVVLQSKVEDVETASAAARSDASNVEEKDVATATAKPATPATAAVPRKRSSLTGLQCFLRAKRHPYRQEKNKEKEVVLAAADKGDDSLKPTIGNNNKMTLIEAETELRAVWKSLSTDEKNEWTERARRESEAAATANEEEGEISSGADNNCKQPAAATKRPLSSLDCFLRDKRHKYQEEKNKERAALVAKGDSSDTFQNMTLSEAETELRTVWKSLSTDEKNEWTERAKLEDGSIDKKESEASTDADCKPAARRSVTGLSCFLREERHKFREEKNKERAMAKGDSLEPIRKMTLREAETDLRNVWKTLPGVEKEQWIDRAKRENESREAGNVAITKQAAEAPTKSGDVASECKDVAPVSPSPPTAPSSDDERQMDGAALESDSKLIPEGNAIAPSKAPSKPCTASTMAETTKSALETVSQVSSEPLSSSTASSVEDDVPSTTPPTSSDESKASNQSGCAKTGTPSAPALDKKRRKSVAPTLKKIVPSTQYTMTPEQIELCHSAVTKHFKTVMNTVKARALHSELQDGFDVLRERGRGRYDMELPQFDNLEFSFLTDIQGAAWMPIVRAVLGDDVVLIHKGAFLSMPGAEAQVYHQDGPHLTRQTQRPCHAVNVFIPLVDLHARNGPTEFCLGTHVLGHDDYVKDRIFTPQVPAGTPVMFDYRLGHRGLANTSSACRPIVYCTYAAAANGKEFRDSVNFSRKRYRKIGKLVEEAPSREERAAKRRRRVSERERVQIETALRESASSVSPSTEPEELEAGSDQLSSLTAPDNASASGETRPGPESATETLRATASQVSESEATSALQQRAPEGTENSAGKAKEIEAPVDGGPPHSIESVPPLQQFHREIPLPRHFYVPHANIMSAYSQSLVLDQLSQFDQHPQGGIRAPHGYHPCRNERDDSGRGA